MLENNNNSMSNMDFHEWGTSELNDDHKFNKSLQIPSPNSPSSYLPFSSGFSSAEFLISPLFLSSPNVSFELFHAFIG